MPGPTVPPEQPVAPQAPEPTPAAPGNPYAPPAPGAQRPMSELAPGPYGGLPPGPYGLPAQPAAGRDGYAIASLVLGLFGFACLAWVAGLAFGIAALRRLRVRPQAGRGMAVAGIVLSALWGAFLLTTVAVILIAGWPDRPPHRGADGRVGAPVQVALNHVKEGDCVESADFSGLTGDRLKVVPCTAQHRGEVFAVVGLAGYADYPGDEAVLAQEQAKCLEARSRYAIDDAAVPAGVRIAFLGGGAENWGTAARPVACVFESGRMRTGSVRQDPDRLNEQQRTFLDAVDAITTAVRNRPRAEAEDDPATHRAWAAASAAAIRTRLPALDRLAADPKLGPAVTELTGALRAALPLLDVARNAQDPAVLDTEELDADGYLTPAKQNAARSALGLPPINLDGSGMAG
ncbi:DUF4190 domain-containing protein [Kitasatospora sp. NPDC094015]|uniref:DUF4190 domain-containing protein n=1 Tax=Kitasatospora sp. NPDC094015 TaxID=3155205 RepID=UPI00331EC7ED